MYQDVLILTPQNCTMISDMEECVNETFCMWNENECLGISLLADAKNVSLDCDFGNYNNFIPILLSSFIFYYSHSYSIILIPIPLSSFLFIILILIPLFSFLFLFSDSCSIYHTCTECTVSTSQCQWSSNNNTCLPTTDTITDTNSTSVTNSSQCDQQPLVECNQFKDCISCQASACVWNNSSRCVSDTGNIINSIIIYDYY